MKRPSFPFAIVLAAAAAAAISGCNQPTGSTTGSATTEKTAPEKSFEIIVATFRRGVEDIPIGFVVRQESGHSMMSGRKEVSHELIPPANTGEPYRGTITVESEWKYSVQQSTEEQDERGRDEASNSRESSALNESGDPSGLEILDSDLVGSTDSRNQTSRSRPDAPEKKVVRRPEEEAIRTYELVYENGRWKLLTKLDPETEQSIERAFDKALHTQI